MNPDYDCEPVRIERTVTANGAFDTVNVNWDLMHYVTAQYPGGGVVTVNIPCDGYYDAHTPTYCDAVFIAEQDPGPHDPVKEPDEAQYENNEALDDYLKSLSRWGGEAG